MSNRRHRAVVLMDLGMPLMDGFAAAQAMRRMPAMRHRPLIAVSAYVAAKEWRDRALAAGFDNCVPKPIDFDVLLGLLHRSMSGRNVS